MTDAAHTLANDPIEQLIRSGQYREATAQCAASHGRALGRLCMAMLGSQAEADECAQETLLVAHGSFAVYRGDASVKSWLFGIARHLCARRLETRTRQARRLVLIHDSEREGEVPEEQLDARRRAFRVRSALDQLKPTEREALVLHFEGGLTFREVAMACGIDEAAARKRASRGLLRLRQLMNDEAAR